MVFEIENKVIYVVVLRSIYVIIVEALLFYKKFRRDLENIEFDFNPYNPCVTNRIKYSKQHKFIFHVEDVMPSHVNHKVNDKFKESMNHNYNKHSEVKCTRSKLHEYLGMNFDFTEKLKVRINMDNYV